MPEEKYFEVDGANHYLIQINLPSTKLAEALSTNAYE